MVPFESWCGCAWRARSRSVRRSNSEQQVMSVDGAGALEAHVGRDYVLVGVSIEIDDVGFGGFDQNRRMSRADDAEMLLIYKLPQHFQNAALVRSGERHLRFVEQKRGSVRQFGKALLE